VIPPFIAKGGIHFRKIKVLTSPLVRCRESAAILAAHLKWRAAEMFPDLAEIDLACFQPSNGESFADLLHLSWPIFEHAAGCGANRVAVVTHAGVNRVLLCWILGIPLDSLFLSSLQPSNGRF
jgi:broad specificity phosphatase PhoE